VDAVVKTERVVENLNRALHAVFAADPRTFLIGEDLLDPYGGAFKVGKGLSTLYPDRVITTPLSEESFVGFAGGLALCGDKPIVEIMFGDFIALAFDQLLNFASKSVSMYGRRVPLDMVVRCPVGGSRSYGPTHSQSLQKHFIGIPNLSLYELSPFVDNSTLLPKLLSLGNPSILFEDKTLYTQSMFTDGRVDELFSYRLVGDDVAQVSSSSFGDQTHLLIVPGGLTSRALAAARKLFVEDEIECTLLVPSRLYPLDLEPILALARKAKSICIAEEGTAGGTWGEGLATRLYAELLGTIKKPIRLVSSKDSIIPSAMHLERDVLTQAEDLYRAIRQDA
jgi:pyruvate/2-oxoglutarate/acetoin dehydrogenase E1 component